MTPETRRKEGVGSRVQRAAQADSIAGAANALFGGVVDRYGDAFEPIRPALNQANIHILFRTYVSLMFLAGIVTFISLLFLGLVVSITLQPPLPLIIILLLVAPVLISSILFGGMYLYPSWKAKKRAADINRNLPFALNHMSAVAGAGVPPSAMFQLLVNFNEYGEIAAEAEKVVTRVQAFGEDVTTAMRDVARDTPSDDMKEVFYGIISTVETGGNLTDFLKQRAERSLFDYRIRREKEIQRLTTFASFYTAILVAAPLFLVTILAILELIGGDIFGFPIKSSCGIVGAVRGQCPLGVIDMGAFFAIPILNILFIVAMEVFQPEI